MNYQDILERKRERLFGHLRLPIGRGVEIGPLSRPLVRRHESEVYYIDHCSTEDLRAKYAGVEDAHVDAIVNVDFVSGGEPLAELIGNKAPLDYVVASHVIEHVPDLMGWLLDMHASLKYGGRLHLVIPDKRFTFDLHRRLSAFEEVNSAYTEKRTRPGLRLVLDHFANVVSADCFALWDDYSKAAKAPFAHGPEFLDVAYQHFHEGRYIDIHCWVFTPWSFMQMMGNIVEQTGVGFRLERFLTTPKFDLEFYVTLEKSEMITDWKEQAKVAFETQIHPESS